MRLTIRSPRSWIQPNFSTPEHQENLIGFVSCGPFTNRQTDMRVLFRDEVLVAVEKPAGLLVHRTALAPGERRAAVQLLRDQLGQRVLPVHRLDRATSGVLLFALDRATAARLGEAFVTHAVRKTYLAVVRGHPPESGEVDHPLSPRPGATAVAARTRWRRLATCELPVRVDRYPTSRYALVELEPVTGRRHQLRRHLQHLSHPVIGDTIYGKARHNHLFEERFGVRALLLACTALEFAHPATGQLLRIATPPGGGFARVLQALGWAS